MNHDNPTAAPFAGWSIEHFLDRLPLFATAVCGGERMRGASDKEIQAWSWGIEDTEANVRRLIQEWRTSNGQ